MRPRVACMRAGAVCVPTQSLRLLQRMPRLGEHQCSRDGDGTFGKWLIELGRTDVLLIERWHARVGDVAVADAILDRLIQPSHRLSFTRGSWRQATKTPKKGEEQGTIATTTSTI